MAEAPDILATAHVLVLEDEPLILMDIEDSLLRWGIGKVTAASTIERAMNAVQNDFVTAALLDVHLGVETSTSVALELSARRIPFVFTSGSEGANLPASVSDVPFFQKPVDWQLLKKALASILVR